MLILRVLAGGALIWRALPGASAETNTSLVVAQLLGAAAGVLILGGLWTPVVGVLAGMLEGWVAFISHPAAQPLAIMLAALAISLAMIGPGAWSIDARLYGRKQILPPEG